MGPQHTQPSALIALKNISKNYKSGRETVAALHDVSLEVFPGKLLAIVGPSGSGKTTLTHVMGGLVRPSKGEVLVGGKKLAYKSDKATSLYRNKTVGFIFQNYSLLPNYSALENVMVPLIIANMHGRQRKALAHKFLKLVGLDEFAKHKANELSGGQRQRVGIARALVMNPKVIIADEPTGNLDTENGRQIMAVLRKLCEMDIAVVMVTHNDELAEQADTIIRIVDGHVSEVRHAR